MKKSNFVTLVLGTISGMLFAIGMCMALLPEWNVFEEGVIFGVIGIVLGLITIIVHRKIEHKKTIKLNIRMIVLLVFGIFCALVFGVGMCFCMVWNSIAKGTIIGLTGIVLMISLIPIAKGIK